MNDKKLQNLEDVRTFLAGTVAMGFSMKGYTEVEGAAADERCTTTPA